MPGKILNRAAQALLVIIKATKAVVAVCAEKAANCFGCVAMIDGESGYFPSKHHGFRPKAYGAYAILRFMKRVIGLPRDAVLDGQESVSCIFYNYIFSALNFPFGGRRLVRQQIFDTAIAGVAIAKPKFVFWRSPFMHRPNYMTYRYSPLPSNAGVPMHDGRLCANGMPVAGYLANCGMTAMFRHDFPAYSQRLARIVSERIVGKFLCEHRENLPLNWGGYNG